MSWAEVKKINSDFLNAPLNHLIWLNDYKTYGQNSYVYQDYSKMVELFNDLHISFMDAIVGPDTLNHYSVNNAYGQALYKLGIIPSSMVASIRTYADSLLDTTRYYTIINSTRAPQWLKTKMQSDISWSTTYARTFIEISLGYAQTSSHTIQYLIKLFATQINTPFANQKLNDIRMNNTLKTLKNFVISVLGLTLTSRSLPAYSSSGTNMIIESLNSAADILTGNEVLVHGVTLNDYASQSGIRSNVYCLFESVKFFCQEYGGPMVNYYDISSIVNATN